MSASPQAADPASLEVADRLSLDSRSEAERDRAWRALYDAQFRRIYRLVYRLGVPSSDVEDVAQQVFLVAYRRLGDVAQVQNVPAWLRGIAVRTVSDHLRWRRVRRVKRWLVESTDEASRPAAMTPERDLQATQTLEQVGAALRALSPKLRAVLVLCDIEECSVQEASESLGIPINTVRSRRRLAREAFQRMWDKHHEGQP